MRDSTKRYIHCDNCKKRMGFIKTDIQLPMIATIICKECEKLE